MLDRTRSRQPQTGLAAGSYTFTVKDANNCTITVPVTITQPAAITATTAITNVTCNGASTGSVVITPAGGVGPYTITPAQTGLAAGTYTFTVKDANNCTITVPVTITQPAAITATTAITNVKCNGASTGSVVITPVVVLGLTRLRQLRLVLLQVHIRLRLRMQIIVRLLFRLQSLNLLRSLRRLRSQMLSVMVLRLVQ